MSGKLIKRLMTILPVCLLLLASCTSPSPYPIYPMEEEDPPAEDTVLVWRMPLGLDTTYALSSDFFGYKDGIVVTGYRADQLSGGRDLSGIVAFDSEGRELWRKTDFDDGNYMRFAHDRGDVRRFVLFY